MANNFSVVLEDNAQIISAPVYTPGPNPLDILLRTASKGLSQFAEDQEARTAQRAKEAEEAQQANADDYFKHSLVKFMSEARAENENPWTSLTQGFSTNVPAAIPENTRPILPEGASNSDVANVVIDSAINSGDLTPQRAEEVGAMVQDNATEIQNLETAISQGAVPRTARRAKFDQMFTEMVADLPDVPVEVILSLFEKAGIRSDLFYDIRRQLKDAEGLDAARRSEVAAYTQRGMEVLGPSATLASQEQIVRIGWEAEQNDRRFEEKEREMKLIESDQRISAAARELAQDEAATELESTSIQNGLSLLQPILTPLQDLTLAMSENVGSNPENEEKYEELMLLARGRVNTIIENVSNKIAASGIPNALEISTKVGTRLRDTFENGVLKLYEDRTGRNARLVKILQDKMQLGLATSFPFITAVKAAGFDPDVVSTLLGTLDPQFTQNMRDEIAGLADINMYSLVGRQTAVSQVANMMNVLKGNATLNQLNLRPEDAATAFRGINRVTSQYTGPIAQGDLSQAETWVNGMGTVAVTASQMSPAAPTNSLVNAAISITGGRSGSTIQAIERLKRSHEDPQRIDALADGTRSAMSTVMIGLRDKIGEVNSRGGVRVSFDVNSGNWKAERTGPSSVNPNDNSASGVYMEGAPNIAIPVPKEIRDLVSGLNIASDFLVKTAAWDETMPNATNRELRLWYNTGAVPASVQRDLASQKQEAERAPPSVTRGMDALEEALQQPLPEFEFEVPSRPGPRGTGIDAEGNVTVVGQRGQTVTIPTAANVRAKYADNVNFKRLETQIEAKGLGQYADVILPQIALESHFAANASSGSSHGIMQINASAWNDKAMERYGKKVKDLSPAQNIDMGLWIWAQNLQSANGNVADAVSMYHSGKDFTTVDTRNIGDGNMYTRDYVNGILAAAGIK